ncbi:hypothetical protein ANN_01942 [Periplaneta americana]|uniref:Uncharacterized protein n=1 Tax=Periplaneta americana TaxID=6978 RepID=A0ABQ8TXY2_PERAM|nr:hypothetical protein ANN_01942 [Periplaneta americana]
MDLREVGYDDRDWINLAQDRDRWRAYAFSDEDLNQVIFSSYLERRLVRYLISIRCAVLDRKLDNNTLSRHLRRFTGNKTRTQEPKPEPKPLPLDCVVKGMGLVMAVQERRASFYIYLLQSPHLPSPPEISDPDIVVKVEGPGSDHGELIIQRIYSKKPTKHTKTRSQSLMFHSTKSACNIPINYNLTSRYIRVNYMPQNPGRHELWVLRRGHHVPGSPYQVSVDRKADDSSVHTTSGVSDDEDAKRDRPRRRKIRVIFRVVDFVSEKMLLSDDGKLQKLTANTTSEERITRQLAEDNTEDTTENNEGVEGLNETQKISASSVTSPQRKGRNSLERSEARKTKHDLDFFRDKCRKVMLLCRFLLSQSSSKESLKMLNTAGHILDGRPVRMTDRTYKLLENAVSAMKKYRREGHATRDHIINENISSSSSDHYKSVLKDYKPELPHFVEDEEHENALSSTDIPKNRTEETSPIRVDVDEISGNTTSQISPDVLEFEKSSTIQENELNDRNISDTNMKRNKKVNFCLEAVHIGESEGTVISDHEFETSSPSFGESNLVFVKSTDDCGERSEHTSQIKEDNEQIIDDTQESITHCNVKKLQENPTEEFFAETKIPSNYYKEKEKHSETSNLADLGENETFCVKTDTNTNHMEHPMKIDDDFLLDTTQNKIITVMEYRKNNIDTYVLCDKIDNTSEEEKTECGVFCNDESEGLDSDNNFSNKTETKEDDEQRKSNPDSDFIDSNQCSVTDITNETLNNDVSVCETISTSHTYSRQDSISVLTPILERSREDDLIQLETNGNNLHISEVSEQKIGVGPASSSSPSNASSQGTSNIFPDLEDLLGQDFTNYMSGDRHDRHFHLWPSDAEFASRPGNEFDDSMIDFDSVLAAPNLEEALLKLEQVTKERNSNEMDTVSTEESVSLSPGSEVDNGNEQADDVEEDPIEGQSLSYDIGDSDYVSLDDIQSSFKQSPDNDPNGEKHVPNETENVEATINRKTCDFQHRENNNTRSGFMGPAEREIWGISDDSVGVAGLSEENEQSLENIVFSSRTVVKGSKIMASIEEEKEDEETCEGEEISEIEEIHEVVKHDQCLTSESVRDEDKCMISELIFTPETLISSIEEMNNNLVGKEGSENQQYKEHAIATDNIPGQSETTSSKEWSITATHLSPVDSSCIDVTNDEQQITSDASRPISVPRRNPVAMDTDTSRPLVQEETACHDKLANQVDEIFHEIFDMTEKDYLVNIESVASDSKDYTEYFEVPSTDERTIITSETGTEIVLGDKNVFNNNDVNYIEPVTSIQLINENPGESYSQSNFLTESDVLPQEVEGIVRKSDDVNTSEEKGNAFEVQNNVSDCKYTQEQPNLLEEDLNNGFPTSFRVTQRKEFWDKKLMRQNVARYEQETKNEQKYGKFHPDIPHDIFNKDTVIDSSTKLQTSVDIKGIVKQCKYVFDRQDSDVMTTSSIELRAEKNPSYSSSKVSDWKKYWSNVVEAQSNATNRDLKSVEDTKRRAELNNVPNLVKIARLRFEEDTQNKITGITEFDTSLEDSNKHDIDLNKSSEKINSNPVSICYNDKYSTSLRIPGEERYESCRNSHEVTFTANNKTLQSTSGTEATDEFKNELYRARLVQITDDGYRTPTPQSMLFFTSHNIPHDGRAEVCSEQNSSNRLGAPVFEQDFNRYQTKCYQHNVSSSNTEAKKDSVINNQCIENQRDSQHNFNNYRTKCCQQKFESVNMEEENRLFVNNGQVKKKEINSQHSLTNFKTKCCQQISSSTNMKKENNPIVNNGQCVEKDINDKLCHLANDPTKLNNSNIENENISASNTVQRIFSKMYRQQNTTGHDTKHIIAEHDKNTLLKAVSNDFTKKFHTKSIIDDGSRSECKMRYEKAKLFFEKLEKSDNTANVKHNRMPSGYNKINRSLDLGRTSYEIDERTAWGSDPVLDQKKRQTISFEKTPEVPISKKKRCNRCGRVKRKKKVTESSSAPTSDTETNCRYLVLKSNTELFGGSERLPKKKISERFHVKDLFKDVIGDHDSRTGSGGIFKGIPHREAVLAALRSIDNSSSTRLMSPYERHEDCLHDVDIFFQSERL